MGKIKKVVSAVGSVATGTVEKATGKDSNNLLLLILIIIVWIYLFFSNSKSNTPERKKAVASVPEGNFATGGGSR